MDRREFLTKIPGLMVLPLIIESMGCEDDKVLLRTSDTTGDTFTISSSYDNGHSHSISIQLTDVDDPPDSSKSIASTSNGGHTHSITLTSSDFLSLQNGETVVKTSSSSGLHTHSFNISVP